MTSPAVHPRVFLSGAYLLMLVVPKGDLSKAQRRAKFVEGNVTCVGTHGFISVVSVARARVEPNPSSKRVSGAEAGIKL